MKSTNRTKTSQIECVETHNLMLSINRMAGTGYDRVWRRALYHAVLMSNARSDQTAEKLRIALELP